MNWFGHCQSIAEVKAEYRRLCYMYHPDRGGDSDVMQGINQAYRAALRSGLSAEPAAPANRRPHTPTRHQPAASPPVEYSRDYLQQLWAAAPWRSVTATQLQRQVGRHTITLLQFHDALGAMWAVQVGVVFSKFAYHTRPAAEAEGFKLLVSQIQSFGL